MRFAKPILVALLGIAFLAYGFDCSPMVLPDQAMECCESMNCSHGMHGDDCCQTGASIHAPFVQPTSMHSIDFPVLALAVLPASLHFQSADRPAGRGTVQFHDPPSLFAALSLIQLRI